MAITIDGTNGLTTDNAALKLDGTTLVVDDTNNRVGIGTASPARKLDVFSSDVVTGKFTSGNTYSIVRLLDSVNTVESSAAGVGSVGTSLGLYSNGGRKAVIDADGYLRMDSGTLGIQFNGDTAAANALDDYEEGTWTPVFNGTGGNPTVTYTLQYGYYTKIGRQVFVSGIVGISAFSGGGGNVSIAGLPFTVSNDAQNYPIGSLGQMSGFTSFYGNVDGQVIALRPNQNTTRMNIQESYESASSDWSTTNIGASFTARFSASYFV